MNNERYYSVSCRRFVVLYILTAGWYELYWTYKHWESVRDNMKKNLNPLGRTLVFFPFFFYSFFKRINLSLKDVGYKTWLSPSLLAFLYVLSLVLDYVLQLPTACSLTLIPLLYAQKQIHIFHVKINAEEVKYPITWPVKILILIGLFIWLSIAYEFLMLFMPS